MQSRLGVTFLVLTSALTAQRSSQPRTGQAGTGQAGMGQAGTVQAKAVQHDRKCAVLRVAGRQTGAAGVVSISYGPAKWRPTQAVAWRRDGTHRHSLGDGFWTILDCSTRVRFSDTTLEPGSYYLGWERTRRADTAKWSLVILRPDLVRGYGLTVHQFPGLAGVGRRAALRWSRREGRSASRLEVAFVVAQGKRTTCEIRWGPFVWSAAIALHGELDANDPFRDPAAERRAILARARAFAKHRWTAREANQFHGTDLTGTQVDTPDRSFRKGGWSVGENVGVPYQWGGFSNLAQFDRGIANGLWAGHVFKPGNRRKRKMSFGAVGLDCSGFVSRCWNLPRKHSTRSLGKLCVELAGYEKLEPGDLINKFDAHAMLFAGFADAERTTVQVFEAAFPRVKASTYPIARLQRKGFKPYRFKRLVATPTARTVPARKKDPLPEVKRPRILVTNDDGVRAPGLQSLAKELRAFADVVVAAPSEQRSGSAQSLVLREPVTVKRVEDGVYSVDSTPAGCVVVGMDVLSADRPFDLVISGLNNGENLGADTNISGTVGAARMAIDLGVPAIAASTSYGSSEIERAATFVARLAREAIERKLSRHVMLNVNFPAGSARRWRKPLLTQLGGRGFALTYSGEFDGDTVVARPRIGLFRGERPEGSDAHAVARRHVSITVMSAVTTPGAPKPDLSRWKILRDVNRNTAPSKRDDGRERRK